MFNLYLMSLCSYRFHLKRKMAKISWFLSFKVKKPLLERYLWCCGLFFWSNWLSILSSWCCVGTVIFIINVHYDVQVVIEPAQGKKVEHTGVKIELLGQIGMLCWIPFKFYSLRVVWTFLIEKKRRTKGRKIFSMQSKKISYVRTYEHKGTFQSCHISEEKSF